MADTPVLGAGAHACGFKSRRLHQDKGVAFWLLPYLFVDGALKFLFCLVLPKGKTIGFDCNSKPICAYHFIQSKPGFKSLLATPLSF